MVHVSDDEVVFVITSSWRHRYLLAVFQGYFLPEVGARASSVPRHACTQLVRCVPAHGFDDAAAVELDCRITNLILNRSRT